VAPAFTEATLLVPMTEGIYNELQLNLKFYHIVALRSDIPVIQEALRGVPDKCSRAAALEDFSQMTHGLEIP